MTKAVMVARIDVANRRLERKEDIVAKEVPLHVFLGAVHFVSFLCSPTLLKEMVIGHLLTEGVVCSVDEVITVDFDSENRCFVTLRKTDMGEHVILAKPFAQLIVSACGGAGYRSLSELLDSVELKPLPTWQVDVKTILEGVRRLNTLADVFRKTGGVHVAALFNRGGKLVVLAEDVGRYNAVDKAIGAAALSDRDLGECFLALSGRLSGDIVLKAVRAGVPVVTSLAAAVDSGIVVAEKAGATLMGFVRGNRMNVYADVGRVSFERRIGR
jgi:FdhD protein